MEVTTYPLYRKYPHDRTFFKVISADEFEEIQIIGKYYSVHTIKAKILPDRNFIYDLSFDFKNNWKEINETEYNERKNYCAEHLKRLA